MAKFGALLALAAALILLSGCATMPSPDPQDRFGMRDISVHKYAAAPEDEVCAELDEPEPCGMLLCKNETNFISANVPFLADFFDTTLEGGECEFKKCNSSTFKDKVGNSVDEWWVRSFMLGVGPGFAPTDRANLYCNYSLQLATRWLNGQGAAPTAPDPGRAACWLERNILPLYIYNTEGEAIDPVATAEMAAKFGSGSGGEDVGPAIFTTEVNYDSNDPAALNNVIEQLHAIHDNCEKCIVVLAVKSGDIDGVSKVLGDFNSPTGLTPEYDIVDMVGFGFRNTDYPTCSDADIMYDNIRFSREIIKRFRKPSLWLYVGLSEGNSSDGSCQWGNEQVHNFYQKLFLATQGLASSGVAGMSFYEFTDGSGPLPCNGIQGCNFGLFYPDGTQKLPQMSTWSNACKAFSSAGFRSPILYSRNGQGTGCDFMVNYELYNHVATEINANRPLPLPAVPTQKQGIFACGETCPSELPMPLPEIYDDAGASYNFPEGNCDAFEQLETLAENMEVSAIYFRAVVQQESAFDPMAISCTARTNMGCNPQNLSASEICALAGNPTGCDTAACPDTDEKPCAYGLAQCIDLPGSYVPGCGTPYNPFDPSMSLCCGISKYSHYLQIARTFLSNNWGELTECDGGMQEKERDWAAYYIASGYYSGKLVPIGEFTDQRDSGGDCTGIQNYIEYMATVPPYEEYSKQVMTRYLDAVKECGSECPGAEEEEA